MALQLQNWICIRCRARSRFGDYMNSLAFTTLKIHNFLSQVDDSYLIQYVPELSRRSPGLVSATLGLDFTIDESHYAPRTKLASDGSSLVQSAQKELWALCEATMPPIKGTTFPFTREIYLGSLSQTFQHFQSDAHRGPQSKSSLELVIKIVLTLIFCRLFRQHVAHNCDCCDDLKRNPSGKLRKKNPKRKDEEDPKIRDLSLLLQWNAVHQN